MKELIENSLDAQANNISIKIQDAGRTLVEVSDNGVGIQAEEIHLAVERHGTSKLEKADDLFSVLTLGFRGEALASIGSVSRMTIVSHNQADELGAKLQVEGGHLIGIQRIGTPIGTLVRVENLFFNIPARLKFLKSDPTERRLIENLTTRYALAYPNVRFQLQMDDRLSLQTSGNGNRREILGSLYGPETARQMLEVIYKDDLMSIDGFISPISITKPHRREIHFFVNGRPVQDASLSAALMKGYHSFLMVGRYPLAVIFIRIPPEVIDINVHPTKAEVRFREPDHIFSSVQSGIRRAILAYNPVPVFETGLFKQTLPTWEEGIPGDPNQWIAIQRQRQVQGSNFSKWDNIAEGKSSSTNPESPQSTSQTVFPRISIGILRPVGQIASAYLVAEGPDGIYLVDQHAAHERVLFERFMVRLSEGLPSQILLNPITLELTAPQAQIIEELLEQINKLGFQVEVFGQGTFLIRGIPELISGADPVSALRSIVENFEEDETPLQNQSEARLVARICKRVAVKAGKALSPEEQRALLLDLESCQSPRTCPHGRPTMIHLSVDLLERQFGRRGPR